MVTQTKTGSATAKKINSVEQCAEVLIEHVKQLRQEQSVADSTKVSIYVTDVPLIHSTLSELGKRIENATNAADIVQVNIKAGNPMPEDLPSHRIDLLSEEPVVIAIEEV